MHMSIRKMTWAISVALVLTLSAAAADVPLPTLRIEPATYASILYVRNDYSQPLTGFLVELVNYPGSYFQLWEEDAGTPIAPGVEKRIQISDMTVGAVPDYVKIQAALYADGSSGGAATKVTQLMERRVFALKTTRELISRLEKAKAANTPKAAIIADLNKWGESKPKLARRTQNSQEAINESGARGLIEDAATQLDSKSVEELMVALQTSEKALAESKSNR